MRDIVKGRIYIIDKRINEYRKLAIVKEIKNLTSLGLKESKDICDELFLPDITHVDIDIRNDDKDSYTALFENNIKVESIADIRQNELDNLLKIFDIKFLDNEEYYSVQEGSYIIKGNLVTVDIINGKFVGTDVYRSRPIENITLKLSLIGTIIEDYE